jgi:RimJ/RimL family protein N-acetyltransferase
VLERWDLEWRAGRLATYTIPDSDGEPCGWIALQRQLPHEVHVGYWLAPWAVGTALVTRAVAALTAVALDDPRVDVVVIRHDAPPRDRPRCRPDLASRDDVLRRGTACSPAPQG